jgi:anti-anti-sigma regulatory factor
MDERRINRLRDELTAAIHNARSEAVVIDMTGVPEVSEFVAEGLLQAARAAHLLGARVTLTGMQPHVARLMAGLDIDLENVATERTLELGLRRILAGPGSSRTE